VALYGPLFPSGDDLKPNVRVKTNNDDGFIILFDFGLCLTAFGPP